MTKKESNSNKYYLLCKKAMELIKSKETFPDDIIDPLVKSLAYELEVHQEEQKMQNEQLLKAKDKIEEFKQKYIDLYDFAPIGYLTLDNKGKILEANLTTTKILGKERTFLINTILTTFIVGEDRDKFYLHIRNIFKSKDKLSCVLRLNCKDGREFYVQLDSILSHDSIGNQVCKTSIIEVTNNKIIEEEPKRSQELLKILFEYAPDAYYLSDLKGTFVDGNRAVEDLTGYKREELIGNSFLRLKLIPSNQIPKAITLLLKNARGLPTGPDEFIFCRKEGKKAVLEVRTYPVKIENKSLVLGIARDINKRRLMEEERIKSQKLESLGVLARGLAHDFNNFLTAILGNINLSMIILGPNNETYRALENAEKVSMRAKDLTRQLLTFSEGGAPIKKILPTVELLKESFSFALMGSNVKCVYHMSDDLWPIEANDVQMRQAINNLVINACQAMPKGGKIELSCQNVVIKSEDDIPLKEGKYVKISLKDHGVGIPKEKINKIFDPYYTSEVNRNGLGLTSAYSIIRRHEGIITVESKVGIGTTFYIYLPASQKEISKKTKKEEDIIFGKGRILIMDDDKWVIEVLSEMLKILGYEVEFANDGEEAIKLYKKARESGSQFNAIIIDLTIPGGLGGKETIKKLLEIDCEAKVIVSSGYSTDPVMADYRKYGFSNVLTKPYMIQELSKVLYTVITEKN